MYSTVIFDLDGTLLNTLPDIADAMNRALRIHHLPEHPTDAYKMMVGNGARKLAERAVGEHQELAAAVLADYQAWYENHWNIKTRPYDGMPETLAAMERQGLSLCVLSNKPNADTVHVVTHFYPERNWSMIRGQLPGVPVKPDPAGVMLMLDALCVDASDCLFVGDSAVDMETAANSGILSIGAAWGFRGREELISAGARFVIDSPAELPELIRRIDAL